MRFVLIWFTFMPSLLFADPNCENRLSANRASATKLFDAGLEEEDDIRAYVGITHEQMADLVQAGQTGLHQFNGLGLYVVTDPRLHFKRTNQAAQWATRETLIRIVQDRLRALPGVSDQAFKIVPELIEALVGSKILEARGPVLFRPSFFEISVAAEELNIGREEVRFEFGEYRKVRVLLRWLGIQNDSIKIGPLNRHKLCELFADLPLRSGYVLGVHATAINNLPGHLELAHVVGIEPLSQHDYDYLKGLADD